MARVMKPKPDCRSMMPPVKRGTVYSTPSPTVAEICPRNIIISVLPTLPAMPARAMG